MVCLLIKKKMRMLLKASASKMANFSSCFSLFLVLTRKLLSLSLNFTLDINPLHFIVHVSVSQNYSGYFLWHSILTKLSMLNICAKFFQINNSYGLFFFYMFNYANTWSKLIEFPYMVKPRCITILWSNCTTNTWSNLAIMK